MSKNPNVMTCGCTVVFEEEGKMVTSIDMLASTLRSLFAREDSREAHPQGALTARM